MITGNAANQAYKLASLGLKRSHIGYILGLTNKEIQQLESEYPDIAEAINRGASGGLERIASAMMSKIESGDASVGEMIKAMGMIGGKEYSEAPATQTTNNVMILPSPREAIDILMNDPAIDGDERARLLGAINHD